MLAMSRAFGNRLLKQFVIADPEIQVLALHTYCVSLWTKLSNMPVYNNDVSWLNCDLCDGRPNPFTGTFFCFVRNKT